MAVYTTRSNVKTHLGLASEDTSLDALIDLLLLEVDEVINGYTGRGDLSSSQATEYYDGAGRELLLLRRRPVTAVGGVWVDQAAFYGNASGAFPSDSEWTSGTDFALPRSDASEGNGGVLVAIRNPDFGGGGIWPAGRGNIKVTYTAGYATIPKDLTLAATNLTVLLVNASEKGQILSGETIGSYSYQLLTADAYKAGAAAAIIGTVRSILARYQELSV